MVFIWQNCVSIFVLHVSHTRSVVYAVVHFNPSPPPHYVQNKHVPRRCIQYIIAAHYRVWVYFVLPPHVQGSGASVGVVSAEKVRTRG